MRDFLPADVGVAYKFADGSFSVGLVDISDDLLQLAFAVFECRTIKVITLMLKVHNNDALIIRKN